jgi:TonB-dependent starch-binding outer membrane protein SusC
LERWRKPGDIGPVQRYASSDFAAIIPGATLPSSDAAYVNASYIRLKNVSVSWSFPKPWLKRTAFESARIFAQGQNLFTITKFKGLDPETKSSLSLPPLQVITMGVNFSL